MQLRHTIWAFACLAMLPSLAHAAIQMTFTGHEGGANTNVYLGGSKVANTSQGGLFYWSSSSPEAQEFLPNSSGFVTFCIELTQNIGLGQTYTYTIIDMAIAPMPGSHNTPMGDAAALLIRELWYLHIDDATSSGSVGQYTAAERQGAFQLAIWELVYDQGDEIDLSSGLLRSTQGTDETNLATQWLNELGNPENGLASLAALSNNNRQDQLVEVNAVPEPASILTFSGLVFCVGLAGWRRKRRKAA